jgi:hypothetical protein
MNNYKQLISSSAFVDNAGLRNLISRNKIQSLVGDAGQRWLSIFSLIPMTLDVRARYGNFSTPWNAPIDSSFVSRLPQSTNLNLNEIYDRRSLEIFNAARQTNKNIVIQWSGGVDSTSMLVAFLKNLSRADQDIITIALSTNSFVENPIFYQKHISKKLKIINWLDVDVSNEFLDKNIILHGDPANCLYGPSGMMYSDLVQDGRHLEPWKNHKDAMIQSIDRQTPMYPGSVNIGEWYVDKISSVIDELSFGGINTVCDWWWWQYFNFKWYGSIIRPLAWCRKNYSAPISKENYEFFSRNTFYAAQEFQDWSYTNLHRLIAKNPTNAYKPEVKKYILDFDNDRTYHTKKKFQASRVTNHIDMHYKRHTPVFFDENWVGYFWDNGPITDTLLTCLNEFQG